MILLLLFIQLSFACILCIEISFHLNHSRGWFSANANWSC